MKNRIMIALFVCAVLQTMSGKSQTLGCTDPLANNYHSDATKNNGSCTYNASSNTTVSSIVLPTIEQETSGLIYWKDSVWTHNDNTDLRLYAFKPATVNSYKTYTLSGTSNTDWEEIAQDSMYIYVGDFGNNANGNRTNLRILRVKKSSLATLLLKIDTIAFTYSDQSNFSTTGSNNTDFDCEAFIIGTDSIYLFTKQWVSQKTKVYALSKTPGSHVAKYKSVINVQGLITGATYLENKRLVALCGYSTALQPFVYLLYDFTGTNFGNGNKRKINLTLSLHQVEGITTQDGLIYYCSNEKFVQSNITVEQKIHKLDLSAYLNGYLNNVYSGFDEQEQDRFLNVYPNPTRDEFSIEITNNLHELKFEIVDGAGQVVLKGQIKDKVNISTHQLAEGLYTVKLENGEQQEFRKIVKQ